MADQSKHPSLGEFPVGHGWVVRNGKNGHQPMILRVNAAAARYHSHPLLPCRFGVAIPLLSPDRFGFPSGEESTNLDAIERAMCGALEPQSDGFLVLVVTTGGMREFVFYLRSPGRAAAALMAAKQAAGEYRIQHYVEKDPTWEAYRQFEV